MNREQKAALVDEMATALKDAEAIFAIDYRGISVPQAAELRARLAEADATFRVVKNRLAKRAAESAGTEGLADVLEGPVALTLVHGDPVTAAKAIATFGREHRLLDFKGGLMEGGRLEPEQFKAIARLPALEVLRGQLVGVAASPITGLARGLSSMLSGLAVALGEIQDKGLVTGEAEPEPEEANAEEAAAEEESKAELEEPGAEAEPEAGGEEEAEEPRGSESSEAERETNPAEPDAGASVEQGQSSESERAGAEDSAGDDSEQEE
jgi:large subunit ribosomal protein L10